MSVTAQETTIQDGRPFDWGVTDERVQEAVRRFVEAANPYRVIAFGSWARGEQRPNSDFDVLVLLDEQSKRVGGGDMYVATDGIDMSMDILVANRERHDLFATSVNSVHQDIRREGVILYDRQCGYTSQPAAA